MLNKIIAAIIGLVLTVATVTSCGILEDKMDDRFTEETEKESTGYTYTTLYIQHGDYEYETKYIFVGIDGERLDLYEMHEVQNHFLAAGYTVGEMMYNEDFTQAEMSVYSSKDFPTWYE